MQQNSRMNRNDKKGAFSPKKKRGGPKDDDDIDEYGNLKGFIDYDYESEVESSEVEEKPKRPQRKAAIKAQQKISKKLIAEEKSKKKSHQQVVESEDEEMTSDSSFRVEEEETPRLRLRVKKPTVVKKTLGKMKKNIEEEPSDGETLGSEDTWSEEEESVPSKGKGKGKGKEKANTKAKAKGHYMEESEDDDEVDDEDDDEDEEEDDDDYDEEEEEQEGRRGLNGLSILFSSGADAADHLVPKRHNMKKETEDVRRFVKLITKPVEEDTIDDQIDQFKSLEGGKQKAMLEALEKRSEYVKKEQPLMFRLLQMKLHPETMALVMSRYNALNSMDPSSGEYYKLRSWMEKLVSIPLGVYKEMPVRIEDGAESCAPFMIKARKYLDEAIYGQDEAKLQIQQFIASKIANPTASGLSLLLIGPPGIGKTSLIKNGIAKALDWPFQFISLGGDSDATSYTGHQFVYEGSHCGKIANCLAQAKSMSMVLMFDELDKVSSTPKGEEVQNLLVHLTDPVQNMDFEDKYLSGIPLDLSRTMFVFSANDITKIDKILLDRMIVVQLQGYEKKDKLEIAEQFLLPEALREVNLNEKVSINRDVLEHILVNYASEETGVRELKRCIGQIIQRINMLRMFNVKELPFHIPGFKLPFELKKEHVDIFLKKKAPRETVPFGMYT